jgi:hypothetical protein
MSDDETQYFTLKLPDIEPSRRERWVFWVKGHIWVYRMRLKEKFRPADTAEIAKQLGYDDE